MVMDYARVARKCRMRLWANSNETIEVRWFRAAPDAKFFPEPHRFTNRDWSGKSRFSGVGEVFPKVFLYDRGANRPVYAGQHYCGPLYAVQTGGVRGVTPVIQCNADGSAACCGMPSQLTAAVPAKARPAARWTFPFIPRPVALPVAVWQVNGVQLPARAAARPIGLQYVPNVVQGVVGLVALPDAVMRAGPAIAGLADVVAAPIGLQGAANALRGPTRADARGSARQGSPNGQQGRVKGGGRPMGIQGPPNRFRGLTESVALPSGVFMAGPTMAGLAPAVSEPSALFSFGFAIPALAPVVALPVGIIKAGLAFAGMATAAAKPSGTQGGQSSTKYISSTTATSTTTPITLTRPTGVVSGTLLAATISYTSLNASVWTPPSGWTSGGAVNNPSVGGIVIFYRIAGASEPSSYTFTADQNATQSAILSAWGPAVTSVFKATAATGISNRATARSATYSGQTCVPMAHYMTAADVIATNPAGYTTRASYTASLPYVFVLDRAALANATGTAAANLVGSQVWGAGMLAFK